MAFNDGADSGRVFSSQATLVLSPATTESGHTHPGVSYDSVENKPISRGNPSEYGYIYSAERPKPPPEVGWKEKQENGDHPVSLYSENVVKEGETTESVDRESIANLSTTKQQWETIFTSNHLSQSEANQAQIKKKNAPKWEVRLPYKEKPAAPAAAASSQNESSVSENVQDEEEVALTRQQQQLAMSSKSTDTESAIEREIRLAHEREEMLKREKEERQKLAEKQQQSLGQGQTIIASIEAVSAESESCQPAFNELTEADRGPDNWAVDIDRTSEDNQQSESDVLPALNPNESIIEREIRLQREREEEIARMRQLNGGVTPREPPPAPHQSSQLQQPQVPDDVEDLDDRTPPVDVETSVVRTVSYEAAISSKNHDGESLIARELRELKEREEEIRKIHSSIKGTHIAEDVDGTESSSQPQKPSELNISESPSSAPMKATTTPQQQQYGLSPALAPAQATWQKDVSPFVSQNRRNSVDSASSHSTSKTPSDHTPSRNVRVQPLSDGTDDEEKPNYFQKQETPIERELRLARERENELRRAKGLPEIVQKDDDYYDSYGASPDFKNSDGSSKSMSRSRSLGQQPSSSMKKYASSRLQQELMQQKERELALRSEGKIISTSEEHIQPMKYMEVAHVDRVDGKEKRNFVTKRASVSSVEPETPTSPQDVTAAPKTPTSSQESGKKASGSSGGQLFSYKEFKQTAESKIERELREMREREEELKAQRSTATPR